MNRREFAKIVALAPFAGMFPELAFANTGSNGSPPPQASSGRKILVLVELEGGNDGLNTLIPLTKRGDYAEARPTLAQKKAIDIGNGIGMHTSLMPLKTLWDKGELGWVQSVGYPRPDRSHFRSKDIWETASSSDHQLTDGWLSLVLPKKEQGLHGVVVGSGLGPLAGSNCSAVAMHDPKSFVQQAKLIDNVKHQSSNPSLAHVIDIHQQIDATKQVLESSAQLKYIDKHFDHHCNFSNDLKSVAKMIAAGLDASVYKVTLSGFDTHAGQAITHKNLMHYLAQGLESFSKAMRASHQWDNVMVMTYSEFGRSLKENVSQGTDHGTSAPLLVMGGKVKGGELYGDKPDLHNLDSEGDIRFTTDFRSVYASVAKNWWGYENPWSQFDTIPFV